MATTENSTLQASCHCKAVTLTVPHPGPGPLNDCQCSICRRYRGLWAYYEPAEVEIKGETDFYVWGLKSIEFHRCKNCGCMTHWLPSDKTVPRIGVNFAMLEPEELARFSVEKTPGPPPRE